MADDAWIDTVRIARDLGGVSQLMPEGVDHLGDCPFTLHQAIADALRILAYDDFPHEERPPRRIWHDGERLDEWWKQVERTRSERYDQTPEEGDYEENAVGLISRG